MISTYIFYHCCYHRQMDQRSSLLIREQDKDMLCCLCAAGYVYTVCYWQGHELILQRRELSYQPRLGIVLHSDSVIWCKFWAKHAFGCLRYPVQVLFL